ncbi:endoplasmic reticulum lectin 1 [Musca vetustissima]|uniref:endoplasmic reticulum lectin 1 n=1 Tax=Musca vetustissima TaxID=27455 RepID=UPI002AB7D834|nr:endoplasmic reticulum lectin 1 [Musca vetustissima]
MLKLRFCGILVLQLIGLILFVQDIASHEAKDFDDTILYKIDFDIPDFEQNPELKNQIRTFYTHEKEQYHCVIPSVTEAKEEAKSDEPELSPFALLKSIFNTPSCSYRIEAYWSYEICHGLHVRQYHEEREGKAVKFQEYYLGKWSDDKSEKLQKEWEESRKAGMKYKTTKIDNIKYPYFEMEFTDGTKCDIINAPRTTIVRYVCYPHGKNEIYSFKETSSCNYEAIILTSALCVIPAFHPEEYKETSIKCYNSPDDAHKPLSMLRQELNEMQLSLDEFPVSKEASDAASEGRFAYFNRIGEDVDKIVLSITKDGSLTAHTADTSAEETSALKTPPTTPALQDLTPLLEFVKGKKCLTGGTGWWKYEFCYGNYVRQFHKDKKSETELFLGHFSASAHRQWLEANPDKWPKAQSTSIWHHYEKGSRCDKTGLPREVDVKLTCSGGSGMGGSLNPSAVSMYLLEPKTCQYILVFEAPIVCALTGYTDEYGLIDEEKLTKLIQEKESAASKSTAAEQTESSSAAAKEGQQPIIRF